MLASIWFPVAPPIVEMAETPAEAPPAAPSDKGWPPWGSYLWACSIFRDGTYGGFLI